MQEEQFRLLMAEREQKARRELPRIAKEKLYHINRLSGLQVVVPTEFDINGKMPQPAVFVTSRHCVSIWKDYVLDPPAVKTVYLYEVAVPENCRLEPGADSYWFGMGDYKIVTNNPLPVRFVRELVLGNYHDTRIDPPA